jgi:extracellular matrix regulatory protein B
MFLHIGGSRVVPAEEIIGIFDVRIKEKQCNKEFLQSVRKEVNKGGEDFKAFIVTKEMVRFSPIAPGTLKKRFQSNIFDKE